MAVEWPSATLDELTETPITYGVVKPGPEDISGVLFIRGGDVADGRINVNALRTITHEVSELYRRTLLRGGELVVSLVGNPGQAAIVPASLAGANIARQVGLVRLAARADSRFVKYFLLSPLGRNALGAHALGSVQQVINLRDLKTVRVPQPPLKEQKAVACVLGTLDDKIELNRRMNETLEAMARAIFKSWFVDFDPVRAKAEGRKPVGMDAETAKLFPDSFVDSPLGKIPKGWSVGSLGAIAREVRVGVSPSEIEAGTPYIALEHMPKRCIALDSWDVADGIASGKLRYSRGDILFGKLRPYFHKVGPAPIDGVCSTDIVVVRPSSDCWHGLVLGHMADDAFIAHTDRGSTGTKMPRTNWRDMSAYPIATPSAELGRQHTKFARPIVEKMREAIMESRTLAALRDALLPKLISGKLRVPDRARSIRRRM